MKEATNINPLEIQLLTRLYSSFAAGEQLVPISELPEGGETPSEALLRALAHLSESDLASGVTNDSYRITRAGVIYSEDHGIIDKVLAQKNRLIREKILDDLKAVYEYYDGSQHIPHETLANRINENIYVVLNNVEILEYQGLIKEQALGLRITDQGLANIAERKVEAELIAKFEQVALMEPHKRGIELQLLFAAIARRDGWAEETSVRSSNEEMDVIIHRGSEYFLVECKWEKDPTATAVIETLYGKLAKRAGVNGIVLSMRGFTQGAKEAVLSHMGDRIILLFGPKDFESMIYDSTSLNDKLEEKMHLLITKRLVQVE